ncbi:MAG: hypothetical protein H7A23_18570 [Leptospiraceae bacterium]|nr:hypothetical protein [Leptospiraceae bacterium]MCP5496556.1 hypothetical protein [Leptospiraceae bacterium]
MSYCDFTIEDLKDKFQLNFIEDRNLFENVPSGKISPELTTLLKKYIPLALAIDTEKAHYGNFTIYYHKLS